MIKKQEILGGNSVYLYMTCYLLSPTISPVREELKTSGLQTAMCEGGVQDHLLRGRKKI